MDNLNASAGGEEEMSITTEQCFPKSSRDPEKPPPHLCPPANPGCLWMNQIFVSEHIFFGF